ncbi:MAG: V-type ATPase 116kDa subunit family protein [Acidilobaceae archaeon]
MVQRVLRARKLEEVLLMVPKRKYDAVVARLAMEGVFHVEEAPREFPGGSSYKFKSLLSQASEKVSRLTSYFTALGLDPVTEPGLEIEVSDWGEAFQRYVNRYSDLDRFFEEGVGRLTGARSRAQELEKLLQVLEPVKEIDVDLRALTEGLRLQLAVGVALPSQEKELLELAASQNALIALEQRDKVLLVAVAARSEQMRSLVTAMLRKGVSLLSIPRELPGKPSEAYALVTEKLAQLMEEIERLRRELLGRKDELRFYYTYMVAYREIFKILASTHETATTAVMRGFVDKEEVGRLERALEEETGGAHGLVRLGTVKGDSMVTKLALPSWIRPFHNIVRLYSEPSPTEVVPTFFLAITFPIAFALMFPDAGHGLLLLLFAQLYLKRRSPDWAFVISVLGFASIVSGLMAGELFGPLPAELVHLPSIWKALGLKTPPLALPTYAVEHGLAELVEELLLRSVTISLWVAAFMLTFGSLLGIVNAYIRGDPEELLALRVPRFLFLLSVTSPFLITFDARIAGAVLGEALFQQGGDDLLSRTVFFGALASFLWLLLGEPAAQAIHGHSPLSGLGKGAMEAFEALLMALGNIPSFLRIMALSLAHASLMLAFAVIFKTLAAAGIIGFLLGILVYIVGNLLVTGLEGILVFAQSMRLHFYEWFSKFYSGGGVPFTPISVPNVRIVISKG